MSDNLSRNELKIKHKIDTNNNNYNDENEEDKSTRQNDLTAEKLKVRLHEVEDQLENERKENSGLRMMLQLAENWEKENKLLKNELKKAKSCLKKHNSPFPAQQQDQKKHNDTYVNNNQTWCQKCVNHKSQIQPSNNAQNLDINNQPIANFCLDRPTKLPMFRHRADCETYEPNYKDQMRCQECKNKNMIINQYEQKIAKLNDELTKMKITLHGALAERNEINEKFQIMNIQLEVYKSDFQTERRDRENAMGRLVILERQLMTKKEATTIGQVPYFPIQSNSYPVKQNVDLQQYNTAKQSEDILIGRGGASNAAFANYCVTNNNESDKNHGQKFLPASLNNSKNILDDSTNYYTQLNQFHESNSSENLNLLSADLGGDDLWNTKSD